MTRPRHKQRCDEAGYALLTVMVFALVVVIAGASFFAMASYETKNALYRQRSSEAFYLADGAIERARAKFLADRTWRDGWAAQACGNGTYGLTLADTIYGGVSDAVALLATGTVSNASRSVEAIIEIPPTALGLSMLVMGSTSVGGNLCLDGSAHVNGTPDFGPNDSHLACDYSYTSGFVITPPPIFTDPAHFPGATYYYVRGNKIGHVYQARIYNAAGVDITTALGDSLTGVTSYDVPSQTFEYDFNNNNIINHYFSDSAGVFRRAPGDVAVVVNFGETPIVNPPGLNGLSALSFDGAASTRIHATIVNTRFVGLDDSLRIDYNYWRGGATEVKQIKFEPYYGIALVVYDLDKQGSSHVWIGTPTWPALLYVTRDVNSINSNFHLVGSIICLRNFVSNGNPEITYDPGFVGNLPDYLEEGWLGGVSGTLRVLRWREIAAAGS